MPFDCRSNTLIHFALDYFLGGGTKVASDECASREDGLTHDDESPPRTPRNASIDDLFLCLKMLTLFREQLKHEIWSGSECLKYFDPTQRDQNGLNALQLASRYGFMDYVRFLVEEFGFLTAVFDEWDTEDRKTLGEEALLMACLGDLSGNVQSQPAQYRQELYRLSTLQVASYFVEECGVSPNCCSRMHRATPLMCAARNHSHFNIIRYLCEECNADVDLRSIDGETCFSVAQKCGNQEVINYLSKSNFHLWRVKRVQELNKAVRHLGKEIRLMERTVFGVAAQWNDEDLSSERRVGKPDNTPLHYFTVSAAKQCRLFQRVLQTCPPLAEVKLYYTDCEFFCTRRKTLSQGCATMRQWLLSPQNSSHTFGADVRICELCHVEHLRELLLAITYPYSPGMDGKPIQYGVRSEGSKQRRSFPSASEVVDALRFCEMVHRWELEETFRPVEWIHELSLCVRLIVAQWETGMQMSHDSHESLAIVDILPLWLLFLPNHAQLHRFLATHAANCVELLSKETLSEVLKLCEEGTMTDEQESDLIQKLRRGLERHMTGEPEMQEQEFM